MTKMLLALLTPLHSKVMIIQYVMKIAYLRRGVDKVDVYVRIENPPVVLGFPLVAPRRDRFSNKPPASRHSN